MENLDLFAETLLGELSSDKVFANKVLELQNGIQKINEALLKVKNQLNSDSISEDERTNLQFLQLYTVNTLYFIHLKLQGVDMKNHPIKEELLRVKIAMKEHSLLTEKARPRLDKKVAERFVRSGLWDPANQMREPPNKRTKFED